MGNIYRYIHNGIIRLRSYFLLSYNTYRYIHNGIIRLRSYFLLSYKSE